MRRVTTVALALLCLVCAGCRDERASDGADKKTSEGLIELGDGAALLDNGASEVEETEAEETILFSRTSMALEEGEMGAESASLPRGQGRYAMESKVGEMVGGFGFGVSGFGPGGSGGGFGSGTGSGYGSGSGHGRASRTVYGGMTGNSESYRDYGVNAAVATSTDMLSTFAIDVDTAAYAIARRKILAGQLPQPAAVRVEEFINYFDYGYAGPSSGEPFAVHMDAAPSPFAADKTLLRVGVQAKKLSIRERKPVNLVFLVDVSGSMRSRDKLALAKRSLRILVDNLKDGDTVALVTYAGHTRVALEPTGLEHVEAIVRAIETLDAGGSTAMASGIDLAYELAERGLAPGVMSRVLVLSDGDANVGRSSHQEILATIAGRVKEGVTLTTVGFGMGNYKDTMMEQLADKGNGNYFYIDSIKQARRIFQERLAGTLEVVAKDVKIQVEFNPEAVASYRLIGYENRDIADDDFRNDRVDAGEIGAGHSVTALYEVALTGSAARLATVRIRAKKPRGSAATEQEFPFDRAHLQGDFANAPPDFRFACAVMAAGEVLRRSEHALDWRLADIRAIADGASDGGSDHEEFVALVGKVIDMSDRLARR